MPRAWLGAAQALAAAEQAPLECVAMRSLPMPMQELFMCLLLRQRHPAVQRCGLPSLSELGTEKTVMIACYV